LDRQELLEQIDKYLSGQLSAEEADQLDQVLNEMARAGRFPGIMPKGNKKELLKAQLFSEIRQRIKPGRKLQWIRWAAAAAILVFVSLGLGLLFKNEPVHFISLKTGTGERKKITLPDQSVVWMGPGTELSYAEKFLDHRKIVLKNGAAFFDVQPLPDHPFQVDIDSLTVDVLGTSFQITAYEEYQYWAVGVSSGKVQVRKYDQVLGIVTAENLLKINKEKYQVVSKSISNVDIESLVNNKINFEDMPLNDALVLLGKYYPVTFSSHERSEVRITGSLSANLKIGQVIRVLQELVPKDIKFTKLSEGQYLVE